MSQEGGDDLIARVRAEFDADFYLAANRDVAKAGADPFEHFMVFGAREGRDPRPDFSIDRYLALNLDVREAGINAFVHWISTGRAEGRATDHGLGYRHEVLWGAKPIEERLRHLRLALPDRAPDPSARMVEAAAALAFGRGVHLTVGHDDYSQGVGGVQLCIRLEAEAMAARGRDHIHVFPSAAAVVVDIERQAPTLGVLVNGVLAGHFAPSVIAEILGPVLAGRETTFAVHSLIGHPVDRTLSMLKALGLNEGYFWVHDYASLCAGYALMRDDVTFCGAPPMSSAACEVCSYGRRRRVQLPAHVQLFQDFAMTVVAPSRAALDLWKTRFPVVPTKAIVHPHATLVLRPDQPSAGRPRSDRPLKVAFLGMPTLHKGWPIFSGLAARFREDPRYEFHHLSAVREPRTAARFTKVSPTPAQPQPMIPALQKLGIDVAVVWALWPETFCIAAYEAVASGAAVLTNPAAGNVSDFVAADPARGRVLADEGALEALFASGEILGLARAARRPVLSDLVFSGMVADLIPETAA